MGRHITSLDPKYLEDFRSALGKARTTVVNIPTYNNYSPLCSRSPGARTSSSIQQEVGRGSCGHRFAEYTFEPSASKRRKADLGLLAGGLKRLVEYAATKNIVVTLENDNPVASDPFFMVQVIEK